MKFCDLGLIAPILKAAEEIGYKTPSPIQQKAIPPVLSGRDLLGCAQTGTGKTAAFAMPVLQLLSQNMPKKGTKRPIRALILTPTRELALQIDESFAAYGRHLPLGHCVIFGGVSQNPQVAQLKKGTDILTATPGRLIDLIGQGFIDLADVEIFVLDEADRMLDMGFIHDVRRILRHLPAEKQTLLFSATMPSEIAELADSLLHSPEKVMAAPPATTASRIRQSVYFVDQCNKRRLLAKLLRDKDVTNALVFTRTKHGADRVVRELHREGIEAMAIHGNKSQNARQTALSRFKNGEIRVLAATDIAARGIDVSGLSHVFNYDLPNIPETYVHRIGRTGRAGHEGVAVSFCSAPEKEYLADIEKLTHIRIPAVEHEWPMQIVSAEDPAQKPAQKACAAPKKQHRKTPAKQSEETQMEQTNAPQRAAKPEAPAPAASGTAAKHRRRGGRRHKKANPEASAVQNTQKKPEAEKKPASVKKERTEQPRAKKQREKAEQPERAQRTERAERTERTQRPERTERPLRAQRPERAERTARKEDEDVGIRLISRRAPAQKYANFEEYMKAHEE